MFCSQCGETCTCSPRPASRAALAEDPLWPATDAAWQDPAWRNEIASRVRAHKRRRGHEDDSMPLAFDEPQEQATTHVSSPEIQQQPEPEPPPPPSRYQRIAMKRAQAQVESGNLIVFPPPQVDPIDPVEEALAEPIPETPRIVEVATDPEPVAQEHLFSAIELDTPSPTQQAAEDFDLDLPLPVAPISSQMICLGVDAMCAMAAFATFAWIVLSNTGLRMSDHATFAGGMAIAVLFWVAYQFLFLYYSGVTLGMNVARVALCTFDDMIPNRTKRLKRAAAIALSTISCGMGFFWAVLDEDNMGWHDRISRTYLRLL